MKFLARLLLLLVAAFSSSIGAMNQAQMYAKGEFGVIRRYELRRQLIKQDDQVNFTVTLRDIFTGKFYHRTYLFDIMERQHDSIVITINKEIEAQLSGCELFEVIHLVEAMQKLLNLALIKHSYGDLNQLNKLYEFNAELVQSAIVNAAPTIILTDVVELEAEEKVMCAIA